MKIIIMTGKFGMGHFAAAEAIQQKIQEAGIKADIDIVDWFQYLSPNHADRFYKIFTLIVNNGIRFYNRRYLFLENRNTNQKPELSRFFLNQYSKFIEEKKPDLIIATLPICSQLTSIYCDLHHVTIPLITCVTDITGHSEWISKNTDYYLVGSELVKSKFVNKGVNPDIIFETGIPVKSEFDHITPAIHMKVDNSSKNILLMGGGLGILPADMSFYHGLNELPNTEVIIITGKNYKLFHNLYGKFDHIKVLGYIDNVYDYMRWADVIVTKPGGVTTFEAIHIGIPIIVLNPCLQQEIYNAQFIKEKHIGIIIYGDSEQCLQQIREILDNNQLLELKNQIWQLKENLNENSLADVLKYSIDHLFTNS